MTSQFDFTNNEWNDVASLPVLVGYAVAKAEDSGFLGTLRELRTLSHSVAAEAPDGAAKNLIEAATTVDVKDKLDEYENHAPEILADVAVRACEEVGRLVSEKAEPDEATAYRDWVLGIADNVANAAKEHGVRVSPNEADLITRVAAALTV